MTARGEGAARDHWPRDPFDYVISSRDSEIDSLVAEALESDRVQLAFQPIVTADATPRIAFHEAFIRLRDSGGRILPARSFIADVGDKSMGRDIDCASLRLGLEMLARNPRLRLAINMSARSIADGKWRQVLEAGLHGTGDVGSRLILEISEDSAMLMPEVVIRFMAEMQPRGVSFALDDFGAGLIAFRHLRDFLFDMVKIDSLFIRGIDGSPDNQALTAALLNVAHQFEMFVVAEGVDTEGEAALLRRLGVDCLQGYLFGIPRPTL
jgi:EAL domain-containing protein (putative c-di-GMP-specific phosphodiesterase class I)